MKKYILIATTFILATFLQSCFKEDGFDNNEYGGKGKDSPAVGFAQGSNDTTVVATAIEIKTVSLVNREIEIDLEGSSPLSKDITVTIAPNPGLVAPLIAGGTYTAFPAGSVTVPTTVVIPAGKQFVKVPLTFTNSSLLNLNNTYLIGLQITAVSDGLPIVKNHRNIAVQVNLKNEYDGDYTSNGFRQRYNGGSEASGLLGTPFVNVNVVKNYFTTGANSIEGGLADSGSGVEVNLVVTGTNVAIIAIAGVAAPLIGTDIKDPGKVSSYDPATKTFKLYARYLNAAGNLRIVEETLVKI